MTDNCLTCGSQLSDFCKHNTCRKCRTVKCSKCGKVKTNIEARNLKYEGLCSRCIARKRNKMKTNEGGEIYSVPTAGVKKKGKDK